jgi:nanoRNase/pAp phosphatase (c-di-AMP/oligoRNAs hydrolase)
MTGMHDAAEAARTINAMIDRTATARIVVSDPVDPDCIGTGLACAWWLAQRGRQAGVISLQPIPEIMAGFPGIGKVTCSEPVSFDGTRSGLIILVDGGSWSQFFGPDWKSIVAGLDPARIINIDHHRPDDIAAAIPAQCLNVQTSSTAQLFYEHLLQPGGYVPPPRVADHLYRALLYDTRMFKNEMHPGVYAFAQTLIDCGADHAGAVDTSYDRREIEFFQWAVAHTEYIAEVCLTLLVIDAERAAALERTFGPDFGEFSRVYKEVFQRQVRDYHYGIILTDQRDGTVRLTWRTRNCGDHISVADAAGAAGFKVGGHRNAGGGVWSGTLHEARDALLHQMRRFFAADPKADPR